MTYLATMALLLTAFTGCRQEPLPEAGNAIRFSVDADYDLSVGTKAELVDLAGMQTGAIKLYGSMAGVTTPVFDGIALSYSTTDSRWSYAPVQYWIQNGTYDFRAVFPAAAGVTAGSSAGVTVNYSMATDNYDLMVASKTSVSANSQVASGNPDVELAFQHACTAVRFLFKDGENLNYYITGFSLSGLTTSGTMTYNAANALPTWGSTSSATYAWPGTTPWEVPEDYDDGTGPEGWYCVIPQDLTDTATLNFTYTVGASGAQTLPVSIPLKGGVGANTSDVDSWERSKTYTYKIAIQANAISFSVSCESWTMVDDVVIDPVG